MLVFFLTVLVGIWLYWDKLVHVWNSWPAVGVWYVGLILAVILIPLYFYNKRDY